MQNNYYIKNMLERISRGDFTYFLNENESKDLSNVLRKQGISYQVYKPYEEAVKIIFYKTKVPRVKVYRIECFKPLTHSQILGTLFALQIHPYLFGDIIVGDKIYILILTNIEEHFLQNFTKIGKESIHLTQVGFSEIENIQRTYSDIYIKVPSLRMDVIFAKLFRKSRGDIEQWFKDKKVLCRGTIVTKSHLSLFKDDVFSVRGYGKYQYCEEKVEGTQYRVHIQKYM